VISLSLLLLLFWKIPVGDVVDALAAANPWALIATVLLHLVVLSLKAVRWAVVLRATDDERLSAAQEPGPPTNTKRRRWLVFDSLFLGYFGNYVLPAKLGEVGRSLLYSRGARVPFASVLATIVFERFLDALVLILAFYAVVFGAGLPDALPAWVDRSARLVGLGSVVGLTVLFAWARRLPADPERGPQPDSSASSTDSAVQSAYRKVVGAARTFREGLAVVRRPSIAALAFAWTLVIWTVEALAVWLCLSSFGEPVHWTGAVLQVVISSFAIAPPSAPGGLGIHQWVSVVVLAPFGVAASTAAAASLVLTVAVIVWVVPLGLHGLWRQETSTTELQEAYEAMPPARHSG